MTVHMIRLWCQPPKGEAESAIQNWVDNYSKWTDDPVEHGVHEKNLNIDGGGTTVTYGKWRFVDQGESPTDILQKLSDRLSGFQSGLWHRAFYHVCSHDEDDPEPCSWDYAVEWGNVPNDVPDVPDEIDFVIQ